MKQRVIIPRNGHGRGGDILPAPAPVAAVEDANGDDNVGAAGGSEAAGWWTPNLFPHEIAGYTDESGNWSYGGQDFCGQ